MEGFLPFSIYGGPVCAPAPQAGGLGKRQTRFLIPQGLSYLELCKSILSQVGSALPAPPRSEATTRECGVQVNGQVDKLVQCSLGPKTLLQDEAPAAPCGSPEAATPPIGSLRFYRPVSIYSPRFDGRLSLKSLGEGAGREAAAEQGRSAADAPRSGETSEKGFKAGVHQASKSSSFQFLEQRYGFFHCKKCNIRWESAYVWCISGTSKVYYKQLCRKCQVGFNPYRVESIVCKGCSQTCCSCEKKQRHINMKRPHRQDLCCRCKGMRLSCDATYSFKYIV